SCEACGALGIPGGWRHENFDSTTYTTDYNGFPANEDDIRRVLFEATAFGGAQGMLWAVRARPEHMCATPDDLLTMYFEHPTVLAATEKTLKFIHSLPAFGDVHNLANIAILQQRTSLAFNGEASWTALHAAEEMLQRAGLPYNILFSEDFAEKAGDYSLIIMPEIAAMSDTEAAAITTYVENGGLVMILGNAGLYNERMRTRLEFALRDLTGVSRFQRPEHITMQRRGAGTIACLPMAGSSKVQINEIMSTPPLYFPRWYAAQDEILAAIDQMLGRQRQVFLDAPTGAAVGLRTSGNGSTAIHIFSYITHAKQREVAGFP
ncbi:MAG: hypothetical protein LC725_10690, partial [Lentisphaerae bacterium]|nr:hypothetical protein [Lentisphaerota bacterium]